MKKPRVMVTTNDASTAPALRSAAATATIAYEATLPAGGTITSAANFTDVLLTGALTGDSNNTMMILPQATTLGVSITDPSASLSALTGFYLYIKVRVVDSSIVEAAPAKEFYIAVPDPSDAAAPITFEPGREYTFQVSISTEANFNMNYIVFGNVAVNNWDATYNADGSVPGALGPDARSVGEILAGADRWERAWVAAVDAAGRPTRIVAVLGAINPITTANVQAIPTGTATAEQMRASLSTLSFISADLKTRLQNSAGKVLNMTQADVTQLLANYSFAHDGTNPYNMLPIGDHNNTYLPYVTASDNVYHPNQFIPGVTPNYIISNGETVICAALSN
jgi:hypothetical protein